VAKKQNYLICHKYRRCYSKIQRATARELARSLMQQSPHQTVDKITLMCASTQRAILPLFMWLVAFIQIDICVNSTLLIGGVNKKFTKGSSVFLEKIFPKWYNTMSICVKLSKKEDKGV